MIKKRRTLVRNRHCQFCESKTVPDYKDLDILSRHISDRGRIMSADKTGTCSKHQRGVAREIKRARHLAMVSFVSGI